MLPPLPSYPRPDPSVVLFTPPDHLINPEKNSDFRVMMARFPGNNQEHPDSSGYYMKILPRMLKNSRIESVVPFRRAGTPIPMVRNVCVQTAIKEQCDYILMIDNDMSPDCEPNNESFWDTAWEFMMARRARESDYTRSASVLDDCFSSWWLRFAPCAVAAPYCGAPPEEVVCVLRYKETDGTGNADTHGMITTIDRHDAARRTGIGKVDVIGTGLVLYDTRMFYYLPPPWFVYEYKDVYESEMATTEDVVQTRNATFLGMPIYCTWDCWAGHHKLKMVRKPDPVCMETLKGSLREAFQNQVTGTQKLHFVHPDAAG